MTRLPSLRPKQVIRMLKRSGFTIDHQTGSHVILLDSVGRRVTVAHHNRDLKLSTLKSIIQQSGLTVQQFLDLR